MQASKIAFVEICPHEEANEVADFLTTSAWPFHARSVLTRSQALDIELGPPAQVRAFWVLEGQSRVGLVRLLDLDDADDGAVRFDLRIAAPYRGRGVGQAAVAWLTEFLLSDYPVLCRIEGVTRSDNHAMRRVFEKSGYRLEGLLRAAWVSECGMRHDAAIYGRLRSDVPEGAPGAAPSS